MDGIEQVSWLRLLICCSTHTIGHSQGFRYFLLLLPFYFVEYCSFYMSKLSLYTEYLNSIQALIEKDWLAFGHPFAERWGMPTVSGSSDRPPDLCRQSSVGSFPLPPMHQSLGSSAPPTPSSSHAQNQHSPIFLQVNALLCMLLLTGFQELTTNWLS